MSTVRTPQNTVNENEEVNVDKTVRATNFDPIPMPPPETEEPAKPLDGTIRAAMLIGQETVRWYHTSSSDASDANRRACDATT